MSLRPAVINEMFVPLATAPIFQPEDPIVVARSINKVILAVAIDIQDVNRTGGYQTIFGMKVPRPVSRICRSFEPAKRGQDVRPTVTVHVSCADPMNSFHIGHLANQVTRPLTFGMRRRTF